MSQNDSQRRFKRYSTAFKQKVVYEIESGQLTIGEAQKLYDIGGNRTIQTWIKPLGKNHLLAKRVRIETTDEVNALRHLQQEKQQLESALAKAHLKVLALESLVEQLQSADPSQSKKNGIMR